VILVTTTGKVGSEASRLLAKRGVPVRVLAHHPSKAAALAEAGVDIVEGDLDVLGCLKVLQKIKYKYCLALEYEENPKNPVPDLEICLANMRQAMAKLS